MLRDGMANGSHRLMYVTLTALLAKKSHEEHPIIQ